LFKSNIAPNVIPRKVMLNTVARIRIQVVLGFRSKLKKGPNIISTNPSIEEMKNLGNLKRFSQKSGMEYGGFSIC